MGVENVKRQGRGMLEQLGERIKHAVDHWLGHQPMKTEGRADAPQEIGGEKKIEAPERQNVNR
jgi:hypothetical protein